MRFQLPAGLTAADAQELDRACVIGGPDCMPWPTQTHIEDDRLIVRRDVDESGNLAVPWTVDGVGRFMTATATLMEREAPYHFQLELARGKVNQVRCQAADWRAGGLQAPAALVERIHEATRSFGRALTSVPDPAAEREAIVALAQGSRAAQELVRVYTEQVFQVRHQRQHRLETALGCRLAPAVPEGAEVEAVTRACNHLAVSFPWQNIEPQEGSFNWQAHDALLDWAAARGLPVVGGPLIDFVPGRLPDWLWLYQNDLASLASFMSNYVETAVKRFRGRIATWQLTAAGNCANVLALGEEELLWLTVRLAEAARNVDPGVELVIGISQPWGEYLAQNERSHSPFIFADTLIRAGLNLAAVDLEFVMGVTPRGSYCRDLLDTSRLLDLYALLGVPVQVTLGYPASAAADPQAEPELAVAGGHWLDGFTPAAQADWAGAFVGLALCKPYVRGVYWSQLSDARPHPLPHCGLIDAAGQARPALEPLARLREAHLR
jgi:hypothetical protein